MEVNSSVNVQTNKSTKQIQLVSGEAIQNIQIMTISTVYQFNTSHNYWHVHVGNKKGLMNNVMFTRP